MEEQKQQEQFQWKEGLKSLNLSELKVVFSKGEEWLRSLSEIGTRIRQNCITLTGWTVVVLVSMVGVLCHHLFLEPRQDFRFILICIYGICCASAVIAILVKGVVWKVNTYPDGIRPDIIVTPESVDMYRQAKKYDEATQSEYFYLYLISHFDSDLKQIETENERRFGVLSRCHCVHGHLPCRRACVNICPVRHTLGLN